MVGCSGVDDSPTAASCPACKAEWVGTKLCGADAGIECDHGPEHDAGCDAARMAWIQAHQNDPDITDLPKEVQFRLMDRAICFKQNGGDITTYGNCHCYACGAKRCEPLISNFKSWCGLGKGKASSCGVHVANRNPGIVVRKVSQTELPPNTNCVFDQNAPFGGYVFQTFCGAPVGAGAHCACLGVNECAVVPNSEVPDPPVNSVLECDVSD